MADGAERSVDIGDRVTTGMYGTCDHDDGNAQLPRRVDLAVRRRPAGVLANYRLNAIVAQHGDFIAKGKGPSGRDVAGMGHNKWRLDGIDATNEIVVLWRGLEGQQFLTAKRQKRGAAFLPQSGHGIVYIGHLAPIVSRRPHPRRTLERNQRHSSYACRLDRVGGYARGIGMSGIHQKIEGVVLDKTCQSARAAKATAAHRHWLRHGITGATSHGQQKTIAGFISKFASQDTGIRRAAKNEYGACHGL
jgi:hypothetical protein